MSSIGSLDNSQNVNFGRMDGIQQGAALEHSIPIAGLNSPPVLKSAPFEQVREQFSALKQHAPFLGEMPIGNQWIPPECLRK